MIFFQDQTIVASDGPEELTGFLRSIGMDNSFCKSSLKLPPALLRRAKATGKATALTAKKGPEKPKKRRKRVLRSPYAMDKTDIEAFSRPNDPIYEPEVYIDDRPPYNKLWWCLENAQQSLVWVTTGPHDVELLRNLPGIEKISTIVYYGEPSDRYELDTLNIPIITAASAREAILFACKFGKPLLIKLHGVNP